MSFQSLSPEVQEIAERELTQKQLDVFKLWCAGATMDQIARMTDRTEPTIRAHKNRAIQIIGIHMRAAGLAPEPTFDGKEA